MPYRFSLRRVVIAGLLAGMLIPAGVSLHQRFNRERTRFEAELRSALERSAQVLALGIAEPLWDLDTVSAEALVAAVARDTRVSRILVRDELGKELVGGVMTPAPQEITLSHDVVHDDRVIGSVEIAFSTAQMEEKLRRQLIENTLATLAEIVASLAFVFIIMRFQVLSPVERLRRQARLLSHRELSTPFEWQGRDELGELGLTLEFARTELKNAFDLVERKNAELRVLNQGLEEQIAQRTESIRAILDHVRVGFVLVDEEGRIQEGFTKSCESLFGRLPRPGELLAEVLQVRPSLLANFQLFVCQVFEDVFPEEVSLAQIQKRHSVGDRILSLEGKAVRDSGTGKVRAILFTIMDATRLEKMERENLQNRSLIQILHQPEAFADFLNDSRNEMHRARVALGHRDDPKVRASLHTLKGNAAAFGLHDIVSLVHNIEDKAFVEPEDLNGIEWRMRRFLEENRTLLNLSVDGTAIEETYKIARSDVESLARIVDAKSDGQEMVPEIRDWIESIQRKSARALLGPIVAYAEALSQRLGKDIEVSVSGLDVLMDPDRTKPVMQSLVHLVRNSLDHGFDDVGERGSKPKRGRIHIGISEDDSLWRISYSDDGRGVDVEKVATAALHRGLISEGEMKQLSPDEKLLLIFREGLSTAGKISELSGRGMGMSSLRAAVERAGGRIAIENSAGQGVCFEIQLPKNSRAPRLKVA